MGEHQAELESEKQHNARTGTQYTKEESFPHAISTISTPKKLRGRGRQGRRIQDRGKHGPAAFAAHGERKRRLCY